MNRTSMIFLSTVILLTLIPNAAFSQDTAEKCELNKIQREITTIGQVESIHKSWFSVDGSPASISIVKTESSDEFRKLEYRFFSKIQDTPSAVQQFLVSWAGDMRDCFVGAIGPISALYSTQEKKIEFVYGKDSSASLQGKSYLFNQDFLSDTNDVIDVQPFTFGKLEDYSQQSKKIFTSWKDNSGKLYFMSTNKDGQKDIIKVMGAIQPLENENIIFISQKLAFETNSHWFYNQTKEESGQNIYKKLSRQELKNLNFIDPTDMQPSDATYYEVLHLYLPNYDNSYVSIIRGTNPQNPSAAVYRQAVNTLDGSGLKGTIPDLSYQTAEKPRLFIGPNGQLMEIVPEENFFSVIMLAPAPTYSSYYVFCYMKSVIQQGVLALNQILQMTSTFKNVFMISESSLTILEVTLTPKPQIIGPPPFLAEELSFGTSIGITKTLMIESATRELLKEQTQAYTVIVVKCGCQKIVLSGLSCFQDVIACVVVTSYVSSQDCAE